MIIIINIPSSESSQLQHKYLNVISQSITMTIYIE
jgi:hypothetical protein